MNFPSKKNKLLEDVLRYKYLIDIYKYKIYIFCMLYLYKYEIWNLINIFKIYPSWILAIKSQHV